MNQTRYSELHGLTGGFLSLTIARGRLLWERELVCDVSAAEYSRERRLEYATCLTTLANWRLLEEEIAGSVDFLSSVSSLLAARVRALTSRQTEP